MHLALPFLQSGCQDGVNVTNLEVYSTGGLVGAVQPEGRLEQWAGFTDPAPPGHGGFLAFDSFDTCREERPESDDLQSCGGVFFSTAGAGTPFVWDGEFADISVPFNVQKFK